VKPYRFHPAADAEFNESVDWYNWKQAGVGNDFARRVREYITRIRRDPSSGYASEHGTRTQLVSGYPYKLVFGYIGGMIWIIAVSHTRRRPKYWHQRMKDVQE